MNQQERRQLKFADFDDVIADIKTLAAGNVRTVGNHSFAAIVRHLAITNEMVTGKVTVPKLPWFMRLVMPFLKNSILNGPVKPGFKLPSSDMQSFFWPDEDISLQQAIDRFESSVQYYREHGPLPIHPVFGKATKEQVNGVTLRHAGMHLSFVISAG